MSSRLAAYILISFILVFLLDVEAFFKAQTFTSALKQLTRKNTNLMVFELQYCQNHSNSIKILYSDIRF